MIEKVFSKRESGWNWLYEENDDDEKVGAPRLEKRENLETVEKLYTDDKEESMRTSG